MDPNNFKVKLSGIDDKTKRRINFYVEPEEAEKATQDPSYMKKLVTEAIQNLNNKLDEMAKSTIAQVVPLVLEDGIEQYTLYVTQADYDLAVKNMEHAQHLLDQHKKTMAEQLKNVAATNFVQDDLTSIPSGSNVLFLNVFGEDTNQAYCLTVTPEAYERALVDKNYASELLESYEKVINVPLDDDDVNPVPATLQKENDLNVGNVSACVSNVGSTKKKRSTKAAKSESQRASWPEPCVRCLLDLYKKYIEDYDAKKLTYTKFWSLIQGGMQEKHYEYTTEQCINKMDTLKRKYKEVMDNNRQTGKAPIDCEYYDELHELFHKKPWIKPLSTAGSNVSLDMDEVEESHHKSKKAKSCGAALKEKFVNESLQIQKQRLEIQKKRLEMEAEYKKNKLAILKEISGKK